MLQERRRRPDARKQELLDAALELFLLRGMAETTISDITNAAGASKGTFYRYFSSKQDLVLDLRQQFTARLVGNMRARAVERERDWWAALRDAVDEMLSFSAEHADVHTFLFHRGAAQVIDHHAHDPLATDVTNWLRDFVDEGCRAGVFECDDSPMVALVLFNVLHAAAEHGLGLEGDTLQRLSKGVHWVVRRTLEPRSGRSATA